MSRQRPHVEGCRCFGCKVTSLGVQTLKIKYGADPTRRVPVIREEGRLAGTIGGFHTDHWDGRRDATVRPPTVKLSAEATEFVKDNR